MTQQTDGIQLMCSDITTSDLTRPYPPSWLDRVNEWVGRLPGPAWAYYLGLLVLQLAYVNVVLWVNGKTPVGSIDLAKSFFVFFAPYFLWVRFYLDGVASAALDAFRPALTVSDAQVSQWRYRLTTLPARDARIVTAVMALASVWNLMRLPTSVIEQDAASRGAAFLEFGPLVRLALVTVGVSTYHMLHQLRVVTQLHRLAAQINIFRARPLYAFSGLTARTGMSFLLIAYGFVAILPEVSQRPIARLLLAGMVPLAVACFVLPLRGMHLRIAAEKDRLLAEVADRLEAVIARLHQRVDDDIVVDAQNLHAQLTSLAVEREALGKLSTWPWDTASLTAFVTTLVLPMILWLLTHMLEQRGF